MGDSTACSTSDLENDNKGVSAPSLWKPHTRTLLSPAHNLDNHHMWYYNIHHPQHPYMQFFSHTILILGPNTATKPHRPSWSYTIYGWWLRRHVTCRYRHMVFSPTTDIAPLLSGMPSEARESPKLTENALSQVITTQRSSRFLWTI